MTKNIQIIAHRFFTFQESLEEYKGSTVQFFTQHLLGLQNTFESGGIAHVGRAWMHKFEQQPHGYVVSIGRMIAAYRFDSEVSHLFPVFMFPPEDEYNAELVRYAKKRNDRYAKKFAEALQKRRVTLNPQIQRS